MPIEIWNILLNVVIVVSLVGYGIWLKRVVRHQLDSKDSTIESLGAAIKANEAEIARLGSEAAPAIADSYKRMKEMAEGLAAESNELATRLKNVDSERQKTDTNVALQRLAGHAEGFAEASRLFGKRLTEVTQVAQLSNSNISGKEMFGAVARFVQDVASRTEEFTKSLKDAQDQK